MKIVNGKLSNKLSMAVLISLILVAAMVAMTAPAVKASTGGAIYVDPPQEVRVCSTFVVKVNITIIPLITAASFNLSFDPNLLEFIGASPDPSIDYDIAGQADGVGWVVMIIHFTNGINGSRTIADITFHCKGEGVSALNFTNTGLDLPNADSLSMPFSFLYNGTVKQVMPPVGGEILSIDMLALLVPWIAAAGAVAAATVMVLASRRRLNH